MQTSNRVMVLSRSQQRKLSGKSIIKRIIAIYLKNEQLNVNLFRQ